MKIVVHYMAQLRQASGVSTETIELTESSTLVDLLQFLAERRGPALRKLLLRDNGTPQPTLLVFVGDEQADVGSRTLKGGDAVTLLSPIAGG